MAGWCPQMSKFDIDFPWVNYGKANKNDAIGDKMHELTHESWSPFNGQDYSNVFIFCMSHAFAKGRVPNPPPGTSRSMPPSAFKDEMRNLMKAVAIAHTKNLEIITSAQDVVKVCEGFAYASFLEVYDKVKNRKPGQTEEMFLDSLIREATKENESNK